MITQVNVRLKSYRWRMPRHLITIAVVLSLVGCSSLSYYGQAAKGHLSLMAKRRPVEAVIADPAVATAIKEKLQLVQQARTFASASLHLPVNGSYRSYADIERRYVVWNVFAAPALSLQPVESCFFMVGCLSYRGFYHQADANAYANTLRAAGHDVYVGGVAAYSTLGWFDDPVLNTMLYWDDRRLVRLIFHELTHQLIYVKDDALFNESFATSFAELGLQRWLRNRADDVESYTSSAVDTRAREIDFFNLLKTTQQQLADIYTSNTDDGLKLQRKAEAFDSLQQQYAAFKRRWSNYDGYDDWMQHDMNNAKISSVVTYHSYDKAFKNLLEQANDRLDIFIEKVKAIAALEEIARHACLNKLNEDKSHQCDV